MYLDWEKQDQEIYAIDIEADSLEPTVIWCMCWENIKTKEKGACTDADQIKRFFEETDGAIYVGHNIIKFDAPHLNRLLHLNLKPKDVIDTLVLCTLYSPSLKGGHSLKAWGLRLGYPKDDYDDWTRLTSQMVAYCQQDVKITAELFRKITKVLVKIGFSELTCSIQHRITSIRMRSSS